MCSPKPGDLHAAPLYFRDIKRVSKTSGLFTLTHSLVTRDLIKTCCFWLVSNHTSLLATAAASGAIIGHTLLTRYTDLHTVTDTLLWNQMPQK